MKKTIYKSSVLVTTTEIKPNPINLEQYCEIEGCSLLVDHLVEKKLYKVDLIAESSREWINVGYGSTQLKALHDLVDEINKSGVFPLQVVLGKKGWIKRNNDEHQKINREKLSDEYQKSLVEKKPKSKKRIRKPLQISI